LIVDTHPFWNRAFMMKSTTFKGSIKRSFSKASATYDSFSRVQNEVNERLLSFVPERHFKRAMEIGCGTGGFSKELLSNREIDNLFGIDFSFGMLVRAKKNLKQLPDSLYLLCCDGEHICFRPGVKFDLIVSASCMHWFQDLYDAFESICKFYLAPSGHLVCALFGKRTLPELEQVIRIVSNGRAFSLPTSNFPSKATIEAMLKSITTDILIESVIIERHYSGLMELLLALKKTGTAASIGVKPVFRTKGAIKRADKIYKDLYGSIRATYQVIFFRVNY